MDSWFYGILAAVVVVLMLSATLNLALRLPSRTRFAEQLQRFGRLDQLEAFATIRPSLVVATAILRALCKVVLVVMVLLRFDLFAQDFTWLEIVGAALIGWLLIMIFAIAIPTAWSKYCGDWLVARFMPVLPLLGVVMKPLTVILGAFDPVIRRLAGVPVQDAQGFADELERQILDVVSEGERHGAVDEEEKEMIESVIEFSETLVAEIMTPRTDVLAIPRDLSLEDVLRTIRQKGHSRIPVYEETVDRILGVLYAKDLLHLQPNQPFDVTHTMRDALFVPESKPVRNLLREFQSMKVHIAIVLDEYGGTAGLVTIEDILEELVGEISDEYEADEPQALRRIDDQTVEVDARMRIDELNDELDIDLPEDEDYETIGGFVFSKLGKIPDVGEFCSHNGIGINVLAAEPRRIIRVRLDIPREPAAGGEEAAAG